MRQPKPSVYVPTLYFAEGLPYTIVMMMSGVFFKSLGADNVFIGLTSFLSLPWILKFAWSPLVDFYGTKRKWIVVAQYILAAMVLGVAATAWTSGSVGFNSITGATAAMLALVAIASATQDVSIDAYYLEMLNDEQKALFVGIRNTAYRVSWIFGSGAMVWVAGKLAEHYGLPTGWAIAFAICAWALLGCALFHCWYLPVASSRPSQQDSAGAAAEKEKRNLLNAIATYFQQPGIVAIVSYILIFRLGDALMLKQAPNFLLDPRAKFGLGISVADMGMITGTTGVMALLIGGIFASWLLSRGGLKRWMWPLALTQSGAILLYWLLAQWPETFAIGPLVHHGNAYLTAAYVINSAEQFAYGMGVAAYTVFLMTTVRSQYKAAHYATATALMALGVMIPGAVSGYIYQAVGYANFFLISFFASLPGIFAIFFLPLWQQGEMNKTDGGPNEGCEATCAASSPKPGSSGASGGGSERSV